MILKFPQSLDNAKSTELTVSLLFNYNVHICSNPMATRYKDNTLNWSRLTVMLSVVCGQRVRCTCKWRVYVCMTLCWVYVHVAAKNRAPTLF